MLITQYYDSLGAMLDTIEATPRTGIGGFVPQGAGGSTTDYDTSFYGRRLEKMVADCRAMTPFSGAISDIEAMVEELHVELPPPRSVKRRRVRREEGDHPDIDRILTGDLEHAWVTTRKLLHDDPTALTTIILPATYASTTSQTTIYWNMAATLALAWLLEHSGRRTCLISLKYGQTHGSQSDYSLSIVTILKAHDAPWSLQEAIVTTERAYLRRLVFRLQDCLPDPPDLGYGWVPTAQELENHIAWCCQEYDWRHVITGAHPQHDRVTERGSALDWIKTRLRELEAVAV